MRIDVHAHYFPGPYLDLIDSLSNGTVNTTMGRRGAHATPAADAAPRIEAMDKAGVGQQILSIATAAPYIAVAAGAIRCARAANDAYAEMVRLYPSRFKAFAVLPFPHVEAALAELARAFDQLGMIGIGVATKMGGKSLADPSFDPVYEELNRRGGVLFVHPIGHSCDSSLLDSTRLTWPLGAPFEDTVAALELVQNGFSTRFPKIRAIMPHLGGTLPFLAYRIDHQVHHFMDDPGGLTELPSATVRKFWYDSVNGNAAALRCACDTFGVDRVVFGTDYPFWSGAAHQHASEYIERAGLSADDVIAISEGNARALFGDALRP